MVLEMTYDLTKFKNYDVKMTILDIKPENDVAELEVNNKYVKNNKGIHNDRCWNVW